MSLSKEKRITERHQEAGFSLIEAMIAIAIFAIGILGAYALQIHATQGNALANRVSTSANLAAYAVEEILALNYEDNDPPDGSGLPDGSGIAGNALERMDSSSDGIIYVQPDGLMFKKDDPRAPGNPLYTVYYNIAKGEAGGPNSSKVLNDVKLIRTHVFRNGGVGNGHLYSHDYYKAKWPESDE